MIRFVSAFLVAIVMLALVKRDALACAVCGAADKTLPVRGEEIAFAGRMRATVDVRVAAFAERGGPLRILEGRVVPGAAIAVGDDLLLAADVPLLRRRLSGSTVAGRVVEDDRLSLGDVEVRASYVALRTPTRRLSFHGGSKAPTAPLERDAGGRWVPTDLQPGCGAIVPVVGATYTMTGSMFAFWTNASFLMPMSVRSGPHPGDSLRAAMTFQVQPLRVFAARAGVHGRLDSAGDIDGQVDRSSGGASVFVTPELVVSPIPDLLVSAGAALPLVQETRGHRVTAPILLAGVGYDF